MIANKNKKNNSKVFRPFFYNLNEKKDEAQLTQLLNDNSSIEIIDEIDSQLEELVKLRFPKKRLSKKEINQEIKDLLGKTPKNKYGVWVYYPWLNKIVHLINELEFIEVRTNRNQYKITPKEEEILAKKKIGIIGLSVGKAIATTIAMERICGELVLADFDLIELSNLNRIQTGVVNFNIKKTIVAAREIAEFDPFLKVTCFHEGLTEDNIDDFFTKDGKLDICIEVCDGLTTKIFARQKAKELGVPVVMNSSDRGTTDIERYDLDQNLPILHGLIDHLDLNLVKEAKTNEEKIPYLLPMLGVESSSSRLKASMLEIEQTITTWPQLASGVIVGGAICTDVCRRILLNQFTKSGRYFIDIEKHINDDVQSYLETTQHENQIKPIPNSSYDDYKNEIKKLKFNTEKCVDLNKTDLLNLVELASTAPSGGNVQPWKWVYKNKILLLFIDKYRVNSVLNHKNIASLISLGAATKNLIIASKEMGYEVTIDEFPISKNSSLVAAFKFKKVKEKSSHLFSVKDITNRITNRKIGAYKKLPLSDKESFTNIKSENPSVKLKLFTNRKQVDQIKEILMKVDQIYYTSKIGHFNFMNEIRWTKKENEITKDGVDIETIDLTSAEKAGFVVSKNWGVVKHLNDWCLGKGFSKLTEKGINSASGVGIIIGPKKLDSKNYFDSGNFIQSLWLNATNKKIAFQPMSITAFLFAGAEDNEDLKYLKAPLLKLEKEFKKICGIEKNERAMFIFRLAKVNNPDVKSLRRPVKDILIYD